MGKRAGQHKLFSSERLRTFLHRLLLLHANSSGSQLFDELSVPLFGEELNDSLRRFGTDLCTCSSSTSLAFASRSKDPKCSASNCAVLSPTKGIPTAKITRARSTFLLFSISEIRFAADFFPIRSRAAS